MMCAHDFRIPQNREDTNLLLLLVVRLFFPTGVPHMAKFRIGNGVEALSDRQRDKSDRPPTIAHSLDMMRAVYLQKRRAGGGQGKDQPGLQRCITAQGQARKSGI